MEGKEKAARPANGDLQVIGAGLPRTGTMSLYTALQILGYDRCHHFKQSIIEPGFPYTESRLWQKALHTDDAKTRRQIIQQIYIDTGCRSAVDYPTSAFIEDLVEMYPNAKFVHGVRSSAAAWRKSWNTTLNRLADPTMFYACYLVPHMRWSLFPIMSGFVDWDRTRLGASIFGADDDIAIYERHNEFVRRVVPKDRLLEFEPKMGWGPLCKFLDVPIPTDGKGKEMPYPHVNDAKTLSRGLNILLVVGLAHWATLFALLWWAGRTLYWRA